MFRLAALAALAASAPVVAAERTYPVPGFDRLAVAGSPDVVVTTGKGVSVRATGDAAALDRLDVRVEDGTLKIGLKHEAWSWSWRGHDKVRFVVTVPMLREVGVAGSSGVSVDRIKVRDFAGGISGSGSLAIATLDSDASVFNISGSGSMTAAGRCGAGTAKIAGSGDLKLTDLKCETMSASIAGSGNIDAYATKTATLATMGSGNIRLAGGARCTVSTAGSGKAYCS